ncbi:MAG TPA: hypothetical protein DEP35_15285 [Deltaproteobacteria bacterium]|nr:hypothetical protein [Deltaproteobacteria bacterium]
MPAPPYIRRFRICVLSPLEGGPAVLAMSIEESGVVSISGVIPSSLAFGRVSRLWARPATGRRRAKR